VASNQRVSVEDAEAVYRRLQKIRDLLDRLPPLAEVHAVSGPMDTSIDAIKYFAEQLNDRRSELTGSMGMLKFNTEMALTNVRSSLQSIIDQDAAARAEAVKLAAETERLGSKPNTATGR
jgi:hypothetical protein